MRFGAGLKRILQCGEFFFYIRDEGIFEKALGIYSKG